MKRSAPGRKSSSVRRRRAAAVVAAGAAIAAAPQLEAATFTVTSSADDGPGSLRQAVLAANSAAGADTVTFDPAVTGPIVLTTGQITISDSLTITGPGATDLTISGNSASRIFYTYQPLALIDVTITGLTLTDGFIAAPDSGGAIFNYGENLTLDDVTVTDSFAGCCGGGIASFDVEGDPNAFVMRNSVVNGNTADSSGGGIGLSLYYFDSTALIENVTITGNTAGTPGDPMSFAWGGGIDVSNYGGVTIRDSRITGNEATGHGGGIAALYTYDLDIENSTISENVALNGGGIAVFLGYDITVTDTTISGNTAGIPDGASPYAGGGLYGSIIGNLTVTGSTVSNNTVSGDGGGIGISVVGGAFLLQNSTISGNQATHPMAPGGFGGGVFIYEIYDDNEAPDYIDGSFRAEFATITGNVADVAGGIYAYQAPAPSSLVSTVIAGNTGGTEPDVVGSFDVTSSFIGDPTGGTITGTPMTGDPMLGPLADNGGPTRTHMPLDASPLLNNGANPSALTTDQRGVPRVREFPAGDPDIGSVEVQNGDGPTEFNFNPVAIGVAEGAGTTNLTVERTNSSGAASIDVVVTGGTATGGGTDYTFSTVTLEFADLETTPRNVPVGIVQDALDEANETIDFALQNPVNATAGADSAAVVTILDDEAGTLQFDPAVYSVGEAAGTATITVTRTGASDVPVSADVVVTGGTADGADYTYTTATVSWLAGQTGPRTVTVDITSDTTDEPDETVTFGLANVTGGASGGAASAQLTILDDDAPGVLQFDQAAYSIGENGTSIDVVLTRTGGTAGEVSVQVVVTGGTATNGGVDYTLASPVVTWIDGDATPKIVSIPITDDSLVESDETIALGLENATGSASIGAQSTSVVTITDDDFAGTLQFDQATYTVNEAAGTIDVVVTRVGGSDQAVTADVVVTGGSATGGGVDYTYATAQVAWADGDATPKNVSIAITDDPTVEPSETIDLEIQNASGGAAIGAPAASVVTINDDDAAGTLQFAQPTYTISENGGAIDVTVTRTGGSDDAVSVEVAVSGGSATGGGTDYTLATTTLNWANGDIAPKTVTIPITDDSLIEASETIDLVLQNPTGSASIGAQSTSTVTITDEDAAGTLQFAQAAYSIAEDGGSIDVSVTRTAGSDGAVSIDVAVGGGTATNGADYTLATTTLNWANGDLAPKTVTIPVTDDFLVEGDETIDLQLQNPGGSAAIGAQSTTVVTITDDDAASTLQFAKAAYDVAEDGASIDVTVTRTGGSAGAVSVDVAVGGGTATNGADYALATTTLNWANGDVAPKTVTIPITDDSLVEADETIALQLQNVTGSAVIGAQSGSTVTILDEDAAGAVGFAAVTYTVNEADGTITITVMRQGGSDGEATVDVVIAGGTATGGTDYTFGTTTLVWTDGDATPKTFTINIANDGVPEPPETIIVELENPTGGITIAQGATTVTISGAAAAAAAAIPTLAGWMQIIMAGLLGLMAMGVIRRGRFLPSILLAMLLLSSVPAGAEEPQRLRRRDGIELKSMERKGDRVVLTLGDGQVLTIDANRVRVTGRRMRGERPGRRSVAAGEAARVFVRRNRNGEIMFANVFVGEPMRARRNARK